VISRHDDDKRSNIRGNLNKINYFILFIVFVVCWK